jgi:hypothetical protein
VQYWPPDIRDATNMHKAAWCRFVPRLKARGGEEARGLEIELVTEVKVRCAWRRWNSRVTAGRTRLW